MALLETDSRETRVGSTRDLTVQEVADGTHRAPSTIRGWLISGAPFGYKFNGEWRVLRAGPREYLEAPRTRSSDTPLDEGEVDIAAWRTVSGTCFGEAD